MSGVFFVCTEGYWIMVRIMPQTKSDIVKWFNVFLQLKYYILSFGSSQGPSKACKGKIVKGTYEKTAA